MKFAWEVCFHAVDLHCSASPGSAAGPGAGGRAGGSSRGSCSQAGSSSCGGSGGRAGGDEGKGHSHPDTAAATGEQHAVHFGCLRVEPEAWGLLPDMRARPRIVSQCGFALESDPVSLKAVGALVEAACALTPSCDPCPSVLQLVTQEQVHAARAGLSSKAAGDAEAAFEAERARVGEARRAELEAQAAAAAEAAAAAAAEAEVRPRSTCSLDSGSCLGWLCSLCAQGCARAASGCAEERASGCVLCVCRRIVRRCLRQQSPRSTLRRRWRRPWRRSSRPQHRRSRTQTC